MRAAYIIFEDKEFDQINLIRKKMTWRRFVLKLCKLPYTVEDYVNPWKYIIKKQYKVKK
jgi:hypothetical protein